MRKLSNPIVNLTFAILGGLVVYLATAALPENKSGSKGPPPKIIVQEAPLDRSTKVTTSYAEVVKKVGPSVVNIYTTKMIRESQRMLPFFNDPLFREFFGDEFAPEGRPRSRQEQSLGSGVIVSQDGYILTSNHVIEGADEIKVALANGGAEYTAQVVGTDPPTEIALLKIEKTGLPAITMADSDKLQVGDVVLAVGNPFGVGQSVTMGIVSGVGRAGFGIVDYEDFIQTDASINPGNSGGALVDAMGRLIGINTFIISRSGGNQGIGFSVPVNMARGVMERIISEGRVIRGFLGVGIQTVNPELAKAFDLPDQTGALVTEVSSNAPAEKAGLQAGDVIVEFDNKKVTDSRHLRLMVAQTAPGTKATLKLLRDGKPKNFTVVLDEKLPVEALARQTPRRGPREPTVDALGGVEVTDLDSRWRRQFNIPPNIRGALVLDVDPGSAAEGKGLQAGDVIIEINRQRVDSAEDAVRLSEKTKNGPLLLRVWSQRGTRYMVLNPKQR